MSGGIMNRIARLRQDGERGAVLVTVIGIGAVLMIIVTTILGIAASGTVKSNSDEDYDNAGAAAYAGLADYESRITADNSYEQYGNRLSTFSNPSQGSPVSTFSLDPDPTVQMNPAFAVTKGGPWVGVPGSDNLSADGKTRDQKYREWFRYEVNNQNYYGQGVVTIRVTGKAGRTTRTLIANLKGTGFINYLYFTDYESSDPSLTGSSCTPLHWNEPTPSGATRCAAIQFASGDTLAGPVRSNDEFTICGSAKFLNDVQSTAAEGAYYSGSGCSGSPSFAKNSTTGLAEVQHVQSIGLPPTNANLKQETRNDLTASTVPSPGCLYTGPTTITYNNDGTMTVYSPWTISTQTSGDPASSTVYTPSKCGTPGYAKKGNTLGSPGGQTINILQANLAYVQNVPTTSTDPNYWGSKTPQKYTCTGADGSTAGNGVGYPASGESTATIGINDPYNCTHGDAFVQGTVKGAMTIAAQNYIWITNDIKYFDTGATASPNLLGLVGQKAVIVYNPTDASKCTDFTSSTWRYSAYSGYGYQCVPMSWTTTGKADSIEIDAAIASNTGTFTVENYDQGHYYTGGQIKNYPQGTLTVLGSIAQKFRGPVATTGNTGYTKAYGYDKRLLTTAPPKFLQPIATTYGPTTQVEVKPAFNADGSPAS